MHAFIEELCCHNETLQDKFLHLQQEQQEKIGQPTEGTYILDPQSLFDKIWDVLVPYDFMPLSLITLDRKSDPHKHTNPVNTLLEIIGVTDSFKCKLLFETLKEVTLR